MNVSIENELIWLAPERTATSITKNILEDYGFFSRMKKNKYELVHFKNSKHSHEEIIENTYPNFKILVNIRNPYDRVFGCFNKFYLEKPLTKNTPNVSNKFNSWVQEVFRNHGYHVFLGPYFSVDSRNFFNKWKFDSIVPDYYVRMENLYGDLMKLPFINQNDSEKIHNIIKDNSYINRRHFSFDELYDIKSAKLVYHYFKPVFYRFGYSPYSFTRSELSNSEKISFLHGPLD